MTISCSSAVWKCQGTTHPGDAFKIKVERPVVGSPVSSADNRHFTSLSGENFTDKRGLMVPLAVSSARAAPLMKTASHAASVQLVSCFIPHPLTLGLQIGAASECPLRVPSRRSHDVRDETTHTP